MSRPFTKNDPRINRNGRPKKGQALTDILNCKLDQKDASGKLQREAVAEKLIGLALEGDIAAIKYVYDRIDGRPKETLELSKPAAAFPIPEDPEERRALEERLTKELSLVHAPRPWETLPRAHGSP